MAEEYNGSGLRRSFSVPRELSAIQVVVAVATLLIAITAPAVLLLREIDSLSGEVKVNRDTIADIKGRQTINEGSIRDLEVTASTGRLSDSELRAQICAVIKQNNATHAEILRNEALIWRKLYKQDFPVGGQYFPECDR